MDTAFLTGMSAFVSAILIFCGSAFLLLTLVLGARLAYFITASITLAFVLIMAVVWSINPLGPVGELPSWAEMDTGKEAQELELDAAGQYPDSPWREPNEDDDLELAKVAELEGSATEAFEADKEKLGFEPADTVAVVEDASRLLTQGETEYGLTRLEVTNAVGDKVGEVAVAMKYDPGNPLGKARGIAAGTFIVFVLHLFGLGWAERKTKAEQPEGLV